MNEYTTEVSREDSCDYIGVKNLMYADNDNRYWAYRSCEWYIKAHKQDAVIYEHLSDLLNFARNLKECGYEVTTTPTGGTRGRYTRGYPNGSDGHNLFYAEDVDTYFIMFCYQSELIHTSSGNVQYNWYKYQNRLEPINQFGKREVNEEAEDIELKIVPAWIDDTDDEHGQCLFLECGEMGSAVSWTEETESNGSSSGGFGGSGAISGGHYGGSGSGTSNNVDETDYNDGALAQSKVGKAIAKGEEQKEDAYFDNIYMAFWDGNNPWTGKQPCPIVDNVMTNNEFQYVTSGYSLRLNNATAEIDRTAMYKIDGKKKFNFSFLADNIPDTRAIFYIKGHRYLCEKITANFTENGMSKLMKGVFYRLQDE